MTMNIENVRKDITELYSPLTFHESAAISENFHEHLVQDENEWHRIPPDLSPDHLSKHEVKIIDFKKVNEKDLQTLGIPILTHQLLSMDKSLLDAALHPESPSSLTLAQSRRQLQDLKRHFYYRDEYGSMEILRHFLHVSVRYAQSCLDQNLQLQGQFRSERRPHVIVVPHLRTPTVIAKGAETSLGFQGSFDYAVGVVYDQPSDRDVKKPRFIACVITVVKTLEDMAAARPRALIEALTGIGLKPDADRVTVALTNGIYWKFFMAIRNDSGLLRVCEVHKFFDINHHAGALVELLKDTIILRMSPMILADLDALKCTNI